MRVIECEQGSAEWLQARCGRITASRICDVVATIKKGEAKAREHYRAEIVGERITKDTQDHYMTWYMRQGRDREPEARMAYGLKHRVIVEEVGFVLHPVMNFAGSSPDGLVPKGGIEIKCPKTVAQVEYLKAKIIPPDYELQMVWNMICCEREWWDFFSYHPKLPALKIRLHRNEETVAFVEAAVRQFESEVLEDMALVSGKRPRKKKLTLVPPTVTQQLQASLELA